MSQHFMTGDWKPEVRYLLPCSICSWSFCGRSDPRCGINMPDGFTGGGNSACRDRHIICRRIYSAQSEYDSDDSRVLCLCDAGADIPEDGVVILCKYYVHR